MCAHQNDSIDIDLEWKMIPRVSSIYHISIFDICNFAYEFRIFGSKFRMAERWPSYIGFCYRYSVSVSLFPSNAIKTENHFGLISRFGAFANTVNPRYFRSYCLSLLILLIHVYSYSFNRLHMAGVVQTDSPIITSNLTQLFIGL